MWEGFIWDQTVKYKRRFTTTLTAAFPTTMGYAIFFPGEPASINFSLMVSMLSALQHAENTMNNTIDDVDYIVD